MPKEVEYNGTIYEFPDEAQDPEIQRFFVDKVPGVMEEMQAQENGQERINSIVQQSQEAQRRRLVTEKAQGFDSGVDWLDNLVNPAASMVSVLNRGMATSVAEVAQGLDRFFTGERPGRQPEPDAITGAEGAEPGTRLTSTEVSGGFFDRPFRAIEDTFRRIANEEHSRTELNLTTDPGRSVEEPSDLLSPKKLGPTLTGGVAQTLGIATAAMANPVLGFSVAHDAMFREAEDTLRVQHPNMDDKEVQFWSNVYAFPGAALEFGGAALLSRSVGRAGRNLFSRMGAKVSEETADQIGRTTAGRALTTAMLHPLRSLGSSNAAKFIGGRFVADPIIEGGTEFTQAVYLSGISKGENLGEDFNDWIVEGTLGALVGTGFSVVGGARDAIKRNRAAKWRAERLPDNVKRANQDLISQLLADEIDTDQFMVEMQKRGVKLGPTFDSFEKDFNFAPEAGDRVTALQQASPELYDALSQDDVEGGRTTKQLPSGETAIVENVFGLYQEQEASAYQLYSEVRNAFQTGDFRRFSKKQKHALQDKVFRGVLVPSLDAIVEDENKRLPADRAIVVYKAIQAADDASLVEAEGTKQFGVQMVSEMLYNLARVTVNPETGETYTNVRDFLASEENRITFAAMTQDISQETNRLMPDETEQGTPVGRIDMNFEAGDGAIIHLLVPSSGQQGGANITTPLHEIVHYTLERLRTDSPAAKNITKFANSILEAKKSARKRFKDIREVAADSEMTEAVATSLELFVLGDKDAAKGMKKADRDVFKRLHNEAKRVMRIADIVDTKYVKQQELNDNLHHMNKVRPLLQYLLFGKGGDPAFVTMRKSTQRMPQPRGLGGLETEPGEDLAGFAADETMAGALQQADAMRELENDSVEGTIVSVTETEPIEWAGGQLAFDFVQGLPVEKFTQEGPIEATTEAERNWLEAGEQASLQMLNEFVVTHMTVSTDEQPWFQQRMQEAEEIAQEFTQREADKGALEFSEEPTREVSDLQQQETPEARRDREEGRRGPAAVARFTERESQRRRATGKPRIRFRYPSTAHFDLMNLEYYLMDIRNSYSNTAAARKQETLFLQRVASQLGLPIEYNVHKNMSKKQRDEARHTFVDQMVTASKVYRQALDTMARRLEEHATVDITVDAPLVSKAHRDEQGRFTLPAPLSQMTLRAHRGSGQAFYQRLRNVKKRQGVDRLTDLPKFGRYTGPGTAFGDLFEGDEFDFQEAKRRANELFKDRAAMKEIVTRALDHIQDPKLRDSFRLTPAEYGAVQALYIEQMLRIERLHSLGAVSFKRELDAFERGVGMIGKFLSSRASVEMNLTRLSNVKVLHELIDSLANDPRTPMRKIHAQVLNQATLAHLRAAEEEIGTELQDYKKVVERIQASATLTEFQQELLDRIDFGTQNKETIRQRIAEALMFATRSDKYHAIWSSVMYTDLLMNFDGRRRDVLSNKASELYHLGLKEPLSLGADVLFDNTISIMFPKLRKKSYRTLSEFKAYKHWFRGQLKGLNTGWNIFMDKIHFETYTKDAELRSNVGSSYFAVAARKAFGENKKAWGVFHTAMSLMPKIMVGLDAVSRESSSAVYAEMAAIRADKLSPAQYQEMVENWAKRQYPDNDNRQKEIIKKAANDPAFFSHEWANHMTDFVVGQQRPGFVTDHILRLRQSFREFQQDRLSFMENYPAPFRWVMGFPTERIIIAPFIPTVINFAKVAAEATPAAANPFIPLVANVINKNRRFPVSAEGLADILAKQLIGHALMALIISMYKEGRIVGAPRTPGEADRMARDEIPWYSYRAQAPWESEPSWRRVPFPFHFPFAMTVAAVQSFEEQVAEHGPEAGLLSNWAYSQPEAWADTFRMFVEDSGLGNVGKLSAFSDFGIADTRSLARLVGSTVPAQPIFKAMHQSWELATKGRIPYYDARPGMHRGKPWQAKLTENFTSLMGFPIPGMEEFVPERITLWGEARTRRDILGIPIPAQWLPEALPESFDRTEAEFDRLGYYPTPLTTLSIDGKEAPLTMEQKQSLAFAYGEEIKEQVPRLINNAGYHSLDDERKLDRLTKLFSDARKRARARLLRFYPEIREQAKEARRKKEAGREFLQDFSKGQLTRPGRGPIRD